MRTLLVVTVSVALASAWTPLLTDERSPARHQEPPQRVLFIGNSLTAVNDLPAIVEALSRAADGPHLAVRAVTAGNFSLEDHWNQGAAREALAREPWTWVVLQQGPSALPESQVNLRTWTRRFDQVVRQIGARTALYMVWPSRTRAFDFGGVRESYAAAARDVSGILLPAGDAWREAWAIDRGLRLYGPDGFHPSELGSYLAALVIYQGLSGRETPARPPALVVSPGRVVQVDDRTASVLGQAARAALSRSSPGR